MKIKGKTLLEIMEAATCSLPSQIGAFPQVSGIRYCEYESAMKTGSSMKIPTYFAPAKPGSRVTIHEIGGKPFDADKVYTLVTTEFICRGERLRGNGGTGGCGYPGHRVMWMPEAVEETILKRLKGTVS